MLVIKLDTFFTESEWRKIQVLGKGGFTNYIDKTRICQQYADFPKL